jgi:hypothetical protein
MDPIRRALASNDEFLRMCCVVSAAVCSRPVSAWLLIPALAPPQAAMWGPECGVWGSGVRWRAWAGSVRERGNSVTQYTGNKSCIGDKKKKKEKKKTLLLLYFQLNIKRFNATFNVNVGVSVNGDIDINTNIKPEINVNVNTRVSVRSMSTSMSTSPFQTTFRPS